SRLPRHDLAVGEMMMQTVWASGTLPPSSPPSLASVAVHGVETHAMEQLGWRRAQWCSSMGRGCP
ncbi:MAG: hypothetical protein ACK55A_11940, partial [Gemmatimonas sp.]